MRRRRTLRVAMVLVAVGVAAFSYDAWRSRRTLDEARQAIERGDLRAAGPILEQFARSRPWLRGAESDYLLGLTRWASGRQAEALDAFDRIPASSEYAGRAAFFRVEAALGRGGFAEAEQILRGLIQGGGPGLNPARQWLAQVLRIQARFDEARPLIRDCFAEADNPVGLLHELWLLDRGTVGLEIQSAALRQAAALAPDDDRVRLGLARVAILDGDLDEARRLLDPLIDARPDRAVWLAELDRAAAAEQPVEVLKALRAIGPEGFDPADRLDWRVWLLRRLGDADRERRALERRLEVEPNDPRTLQRLAELLRRTGQDDRAAGLLLRKAEVDDAISRYKLRMGSDSPASTRDERLEMARLAEAAGRPWDADRWRELALGAEAESNKEPPSLLAQRRISDANVLDDPWSDIDASALVAARDASGSGRARLRFVEAAESAGLDFTFVNDGTPRRRLPEVMSGGLGLLDYDRDGWLDLYVAQGGPFPPPEDARSGDRLYRNRGNGTFEDVTKAAGLADLPGGYGQGVAVGDIDNDGFPDVFLSRWRSYALYRNRGDGTFEDLTEAAGLGGDRGWPSSAAFADLDGDGDLDLYVCHYLQWDPARFEPCRDGISGAFIACPPTRFPAEPDRVFRNDGGRFVDVTAEAGIADSDGRGLGVIATDLDGDGLLDLYVANDQTGNDLWRNLGGMRFEDFGALSGASADAGGGYQAGMGVGCGDLDGDGRPDLVVTNYYGEGTTFYRNLGAGTFVDDSTDSGLYAASRYLLGFGIGLFDADNDGDLDLLSANGHLHDLPDNPYRMPSQLLENDGGAFRDVTSSTGDALTQPRLGRAFAQGDLDNDGLVDAILLDHDGPLALLRNRTEDPGHWLTLQLEGSASNRDAVGARVTVLAGDQTQFGWRIGGGSYQSAPSPRLHFGLGEAEAATVEVAWPSGLVERHEALPSDAIYHLREGDGRADRLGPSPGR
ncbi:CRTAC1 family protein [Tautonia rosea]|uniref:CRTAC1 family protein n=1 Tax=Tautonia rosea TaxID=2728037 RepID=UPI001472E741|nr:CRTAC1 family protein [Tautonia rosea]